MDIKLLPDAVIILLVLMYCILSGSCRPSSRLDLDVSWEVRRLWADVDYLKDAMRTYRRKSCPAGYVQFKRSCLRFVMDEEHKAIWKEAEQYCLSQGGHLVTVERPKKEKFIKRYLSKNFKSYLHTRGTLLYTGLIYTDRQARLPFDPHDSTDHPDNSTIRGNGFRWVGNRRLVGAGGRWKPTFSPHYKGPDNKYLTCVVINFYPSSQHASFWWRGHTCSEEKHNFICEVRLPGRP